MKRKEGGEGNIQPLSESESKEDFSEMMGMEDRGGNIEPLSEMRRRGKY